MNFVKSALVAAAVCASAPVLAQSQDVPDIEPKVIEILDNAAEFLMNQNDLSVSWYVSYDTVNDGREKITQTRNGFNLLDRDAGLYSYVEDGLATREYYYDGVTFSVVDPDQDVYAQIAFAGGYEALIDRVKEEYGLDLPLWSLISMRYKSQYQERADKGAYLGMTRVGGEVAHHISLSSYDEDWQIWVAADEDSPRILMLVGTDPYTQGWPQYRAYFTDWNFEPEIAEDAFTYQPGENSEEMYWPKVEPK